MISEQCVVAGFALALVWVGMVIGLGSALIHFAVDSAMDCITKDKS